MNYFRDHVFEKVLSNERAARYYLLEMTMHGVEVDRPICDLSYEEMKSVLRYILAELEARDGGGGEDA